MRPPIICGIDGSPASLDAARLGCAIARRLGLPVDLVHVTRDTEEAEHLSIARTPAGQLPGRLEPNVALRVEQGSPVGMLDDMAHTVSPSAPGACRTLVVDRPVGCHLHRLAGAEDAALVALGPPHHGPLVSALRGSPAGHLLRRWMGPFLVCPSPKAVLA